MKRALFIFLLLSNSPFSFGQNCQVITTLPSEVGTTTTFELTCNNDLEVTWSFGDGNGSIVSSSSPVQHTYHAEGIYTVFARFGDGSPPIHFNHAVVRKRTELAPTRSSTIAIDHGLNLVWNVNSDNNSVTCTDALNLTKKIEIPVGKRPRTLSVDKDHNVWVVNQDDATISVLSQEGQLAKTIELPYASRPYGLAISPSGLEALVTLQGTGRLLKISTAAKSIISDISINPSPRGIAITHDSKHAYVSRFVSAQDRGQVDVVEISSMTVKKSITLSIDTTPDFDDNGRGIPNFISSLTISPDGSTIRIPSNKSNVLRGEGRDGRALSFDNTVRSIASLIDLDANEEDISSRVDFNDTDMAYAAEFSRYGNLVFVVAQGNNKVEVINAYTNARVGKITDTGLAPQGLVLNESGSRLFVHNFLSRSVRVYDVMDIILSNAFEPKHLVDISTVSDEHLSDQVLKGKQIFYNAEDTRMSRSGYISCASCHLDGESDERVWDFTDRGEGFRNTHSLLGKGGVGLGRVHWTGNFDEIQDFENDIRNGFGGKGFMEDADFQKGTTSDPLGDNKKGKSADLDALAAYVTSLDKALPSPYRNSDGTLTEDGIKGRGIFQRLQCNTCHAGPDFTDKSEFQLHDVGTIKSSSGKRVGKELTGFVTPPLKGLWHTAPYLHDGSAATLRDVLTTHNQQEKHGRTLALKDIELDHLVSYLMQIDENETENTYITSVDDQAEAGIAEVVVYPNPASDYIFFNNPENADWKITDVAGRVYQKGTQSSADIGPLKTGMYLIRFGGKSARFLKE